MMQLERKYNGLITLVGPTTTRPVSDPLTVLSLDNRLYIDRVWSKPFHINITNHHHFTLVYLFGDNYTTVDT